MCCMSGVTVAFGQCFPSETLSKYEEPGSHMWHCGKNEDRVGMAVPNSLGAMFA